MKKKSFKIIIDMLFYLVGCFAYSAAITMFISANEISPGGLTGVATVLDFLYGLPSGLVVFILNIPILVFGFLKLGGVFVLKTAAAVTILSVCLEFTDKFLPKIKTDNILASLFGGMLMGLGISLVMLRGATTGGIDIIAKLINKRFRHLTVGRLMLAIDAIIIAFAAVAYRNIESALYSAVALFASSKIMDTVLYGADKGKIIHIVTDAPEAICRDVNEKLGRGITRLSAMGGWTGQEHAMLMCTVRVHEVSSVYSVVYEHDAKAFIVVSDAGEIIGEGFKSEI